MDTKNFFPSGPSTETFYEYGQLPRGEDPAAYQLEKFSTLRHSPTTPFSIVEGIRSVIVCGMPD